MTTRRQGAPARVSAWRVPAVAKVNLVLAVGPARPDGFHDLATLFAPVELADEVSVRVHHGRPGGVTCRVPGRPELSRASNLAARAAERFRIRFGREDRIDVTIRKRIPVTAGLGGGSSDAAAVLRALARAYRVRDAAALVAFNSAMALETEGKVLTYSGDTEWVDALFAASRNADLLIAEAYFFERKVRFHLDYATLREKLSLIGAKRLILTHMSDDVLGRIEEVDVEYAEDGKQILL